MKGWQIICSQDGSLVAEVLGDYKKGDTPPLDAYAIKTGEIKYSMPGNEGNPELVCTHPYHQGRSRAIWKKI